MTIEGAEAATDYQGDPAIIVTYTWTNNSDSDEMFSVVLSDRCFQNGVQLDSAVISGMSTDAFKEIKPGATQTLQKAYELDDSSPVTVEVTETFTFRDEILAEKTFDSI